MTHLFRQLTLSRLSLTMPHVAVMHLPWLVWGDLVPMKHSLCCFGFAALLFAASTCLAQQPQSQTQPEKAGEKPAEKPKDEKKPPIPEEKNVVTKRGSNERVEFALKLPGQDETGKKEVFLPIDAKFPKEDFERLVDAREKCDSESEGSVQMGDAGSLLPPPYKLVDNDTSLLDASDLVFIDPVSTGYSRAVPGEAPKQFHGVEEDVESVAEFIRVYATRNKRWSSPKFLAGESYGTTRAAGLSGYLQQRFGMYLNGIVLISAILNFETAEFDTGNDLPYVLYLPTYTAIAWYHKKLPADLQGDLQKALDESRKFAMGEYTDALAAGDALPAARRAETAQKLARLTGLSPDYIDRTNLRIEIMRFTKELLRGQRRTIGRIDARFLGIDRDAAGENPEFDPSIAAITGPYSGMLNDYVRSDLKFDSDLPYEILTGRVQPWNYAPFENRYVNVAETLRRAMTQNPFLHVFVAKGYYDLATPFFAADYTFDHLGLDPTLRAHLGGAYYEAGHMMYVHTPSRVKLEKDIAQFLKSSVAPGPAQ